MVTTASLTRGPASEAAAAQAAQPSPVRPPAQRTSFPGPPVMRLGGGPEPSTIRRSPPRLPTIPPLPPRASDVPIVRTASIQSSSAPKPSTPGTSAHPTSSPTSQPQASGDVQKAPGNVAGPATPVPSVAPAPASPGAGSVMLGRIAGAPRSAIQAQAMDQAQFIDNDSMRSESEISRIAATRRAQVKGFFAGARGGLSSFFTNAVVTVQKFISDRQAEVMAAVTSAFTWIRTAIAGALLAAQALITLTRARIGQLVQRLKTSLQTRVKSITGQITGLIDSIPFPDLPGIGWIRSQAVNLLSRAASFVNRALGGLFELIQSALDTALRLVDSFLGLLARALDAALALVSAAILRIVQMIGAALNRAAAIISSTLRRALFAMIVPVLNLVERLIIGVIGGAEQGAQGLVRTNREQYLSSLADSLTPKAPPPGARAVSEASQIAVMRELARDASVNNRRIVQTFAFVMGGAILKIISTITSVVARIFAAVSAALAAIVRAIVTLVRLAIQILTQAVQAYIEFIRELIRSLTTWLDGVAEEIRSWMDGGIDRFIEFARDALSRIGRFAARFVRNLILGRSVAESLEDALGEFKGARYIPSFKPPPLPPPGVVIGIILLIFVALVGLVGGTVIIVGGTVIIIIGGATYVIPVAVAVAIVLVLLAIVGLLVWLLYRWITKPKPPPGKRVIFVTPAVLELGVGGRDIGSTATIAPGTPARPPLTWTINPGGAVPAGVSILGSGRIVKVRAGHPPPPTVTGGAPITVRAALTANPADFADSAPVMIVQVVSATYAAAPPLAPVPSLGPGIPPPNTAEPNRDTIAGNTAVVNAVTAPTGRPNLVTLRRPLGATVSGTTITPGSNTGDIKLRITDTATRARLDETKPATAGPAALMAELTINAVPLRVKSLAGSGALGPYGVLNTINFTPSDTEHPPLQRIVGELITNGGDDFNVEPPNTFPPPPIGFNPTFNLRLAVPADSWGDQLVTDPAALNVADRLPAIDVNRFVGPRVPSLPRRLIYRQRFQYSSWRGAGTVISKTIDDGQHIRSLIGKPGAFKFRTEHRFPAGAAPVHNEAYIGNDLIVFSNVVATPTAAGATALAADGAATANLTVASNVAGRTVNWSVRSGGIAIIAGNPAVLPAPATLRAGVRTGTFGVRAADTIFPNRLVDGSVGVVAVALRNMRAAPNPVPSGTATSTVSLNANPGGRTVNWGVDAAAAAAGVTVTPNVTGPGVPGMSVVVTRPAGFTGTVTVTATDSVLGARTNNVRVRFK